MKVYTRHYICVFNNFYKNYNRTSGGRLHLVPDVGKISLAEAVLVEEPSESEREDEGKNRKMLEFILLVTAIIISFHI